MITGTGPIATLEEAAKCIDSPVNSLKGFAYRDILRTHKVSGTLRVVAQEWLEEYYNDYFRSKTTKKLDFSRGLWHSYDDALMALPEAAEYLGLSHRGILAAVRTGRLQTIRMSSFCHLTTPEWLRQCRPAHLPDYAFSTNKSGRASPYSGVHWSVAARKWQSTVREGGKRYHLGVFSSEELAHERCLLAVEIGIVEYRRIYPLKKPVPPRRVQH